tara:strand:- start:34 stop:1518 length:1485 start_codon:yes stop_codon:yes gene_type:complete
MAGRVQILSKGIIGDQLLDNPSFSFFTKKYNKYTNWANENFKIDFDNQIYTGDYIEATIPAKNGDILKGITLSFDCDISKLPTLIDGTVPTYGQAPNYPTENTTPLINFIDKFGISVIEHVELLLGDQLIDKITGDDIFIYNELNVPDSYSPSLEAMHGKYFRGQGYGIQVQEWLDGQYKMASQGANFRIQLPFYFHNRPKYGFPLCAINKQELKLRIKLRTSQETIFVGGAGQNDAGEYGDPDSNMPLSFIWNPIAEKRLKRQLEMENFTVNLDLVHLDKTERCKLQSKPINLLIEQHQHNTFSIEPQSKFGEFKLDLKNPVKEMYFIAKKNEKWSDAQISLLDQMRGVNSSGYPGGFADWKTSIYGKKNVPLMYSKQNFVTLTCDGITILNETTGNNLFLSITIPNTYHKRSPIFRNIGVYSFALQPGELDPSGHLDFSVIKDAILTMELAYDGSHTNSTGIAPIYFRKQVMIVAKSYNIIRINNGIGQILF